MLRIIDTKTHNPADNLKKDEHLVQEIRDREIIIHFWKNSPSLFMGRFQKEEYEVNHAFINQHDIPVLRRMSGGGTVYHDLGNLNISLIAKKEFSPKINATEFTRLISHSLMDLGIENEHNEKRNALFHHQQKFLGSAVWLTKGVLLFHCSLLIKSNLEYLEQAIQMTPLYKEESKPFIKSVRSPVINLTEIDQHFSEEQFKEKIIEKLSRF